MFARVLAKRSRTLARLLQHQYRNTWVLRRVVVPEPTPEGQSQRNPEELPYMMRYEVVENEDLRKPGPVKVILLEDVEGVGKQLDVVEVDCNLARNTLILGQKAVYASPFDLKYYGALREKMKDELDKRICVPYDYVLVAKELVKQIIPIHVSLTTSWTLDRVIIRCSLIEKGIFADDEAIFLNEAGLKGPDMEMEARLIRFYVVICKQYVVPMLGRISHITSDQSKEVLYPEKSVVPDENELKANRIIKEEPYFYRTPDIDGDFDVPELMKKRRLSLL